MKGNWWERSLAWDPGGEVEKALEMGISFHTGPVGKPGRGLIYRGLREMDDRGSRSGVFLSEEVQCRGPLGWPL